MFDVLIAGGDWPATVPDFSCGPGTGAGETDGDCVLAADAGSYVNETDYHQPDWQSSFWGDNYARLLEIKHAYDPSNLFRVHHGVGSETTDEAGWLVTPDRG
jgi:hypothetical protein